MLLSSDIELNDADQEIKENSTGSNLMNTYAKLADLALPSMNLDRSTDEVSASMSPFVAQDPDLPPVPEPTSGAYVQWNLDHEMKGVHDNFILPSDPPTNKVATPWENINAFVSPSKSSSAHSNASALTSASGTSGRSVRSGPLSDLARAGMRAVKRVGACWRCMFLRKKVCF